MYLFMDNKIWLKSSSIPPSRITAQVQISLIKIRTYIEFPWEKNWPPWLLTVSSQWAHRELNVSSRWPKWSQPAVTEPWPGPWLSCDLAVTDPWSYWRCRDWAVTSPWLSCDLAVTELWPRRDWAVTSPSRDWAVIIGPGAVTTVVTVSSRWAHGDIFFSWVVSTTDFFLHSTKYAIQGK